MGQSKPHSLESSRSRPTSLDLRNMLAMNRLAAQFKVKSGNFD